MTADDRALVEFAQVMRKLRAECPWKAKQTHQSLVCYLVEETGEAVEAIEQDDPVALREELGDVLLQVFLHAAIAEEAGTFTLGELTQGVIDKMHRRNPHVFGDERPAPGEVLTADQVNVRWQQIKAQEKAAHTDSE